MSASVVMVPARSRAALLLAAMVLGPVGWLNASTLQVGSAAALGPNDSVLWSQLGGDGTTPPSTSNFTSTSGLTGTIIDATAASVPGTPQLRNNALYFLTTDPVYDNQYDNNQVTINFNTPVFGVGVLMMNDFGSSQAFSYHMQVFNSGGSLGTFSVASPQIANTPSYLGLLDSAQEITKVVFTTDAYAGNSGDYFALDTLNLNDVVTPTSGVPEPSSLPLAGIGLVLIGAGIRRYGLAAVRGR